MAAPSYEVEIRFRVATVAEAYALLPFLEASLGAEKAWATDILSPTIYAAGRLLRIGLVPPTGSSRYYLGYKEVDQGSFANIRREWGEEITHGVQDSEILAEIGIRGDFADAETVLSHLTAAGHHPFMSFNGVDRLGYVADLELHTKLMRCPKILGEGVMVELELTAPDYAGALAAEEKLQRIAHQYQLTDRLLRAEPPTLLYTATHPTEH